MPRNPSAPPQNGAPAQSTMRKADVGLRTTELAGEALKEARDRNERHAALFERVVSRIYRYFARTVWDPNEAEELAQRTLADLETSLREKTYDPARSFNAWLWLKAHTTFAHWCRERETRGTRTEALGERQAPAPGREEGDAMDAAHVLREIQRRLGDEVYETYVLRHEGGLTLAEIAEAICRDRKTVASRLALADGLVEELLG